MRAIERRRAGNPAGAIPVVDIQALRDGRDPQAVSDSLHAASRDPGFIRSHTEQGKT